MGRRPKRGKMSSFTWLDYSEHERRQAMEVIDLFGEDDTRDELCLGTIRDGFADLLFPGTSTIQTRARYFLFVPWVCIELENRRVQSRALDERTRKVQGRLRDALMNGGEETGVIGYRAGLHVQRLPSSVYWYGMRQWKILRFQGTEEDYRLSLDSFYKRLDSVVSADAGESPDALPSNWDVHLPSAPADWLEKTDFALSLEESEYVYNRIAESSPRSLLAHLLNSRQRISDDQFFPWDVIYQQPLAPTLAGQLLHAQNFSQVMHGAALLYNLMLAEQKKGGEYIADYQEELQLWWDNLQARREELDQWDRVLFWRLMHELGVRVRPVTRIFVDQWINVVLAAQSLAVLAESHTARQMVRSQEHAVKPGRARLGDLRTTENWQGSSGSAQLNYRWNRPVRAIVNDILGPLLSEGDGNA